LTRRASCATLQLQRVVFETNDRLAIVFGDDTHD